MFALVALIVAAVAWALQVIGDGLDNPWAWLFATLGFIAAHLVFPVGIPLPSFRRQ